MDVIVEANLEHTVGSLGSRLREARLLGGLSGRQLDALAGLRAGHTSSIESGRRPNIETKTARNLARVLGVSLDWLISGVGDAPTANSIETAIAETRSSDHSD